MALNLAGKKAIVDEISQVAKSSVSAIAAEYRGLTVGQMTQLRTNARKAGVFIKVVRNTLVRRAVDGTDFECLKDHMTGPLILAFSQNEPGAAAKLFSDFSKTSDKFQIKLIALGGKLLDVSKLEAVATLPTKDEAISRLMSVMQAPIAKFVQTLAAPQVKLVRTLDAVRDKKQQEAS
jgi:large subunit ribosomal protein L10